MADATGNSQNDPNHQRNDANHEQNVNVQQNAEQNHRYAENDHNPTSFLSHHHFAELDALLVHPLPKRLLEVPAGLRRVIPLLIRNVADLNAQKVMPGAKQLPRKRSTRTHPNHAIHASQKRKCRP